MHKPSVPPGLVTLYISLSARRGSGVNWIMKVLSEWVKVLSVIDLRSMASRTRHSTFGRRFFSIVSIIPGERSAASIGTLGKRFRRVVVTIPLPAPLSKAVEPGLERGDSSSIQDINCSAAGRVTYTAVPAYAAEAVPQSSDDDNSDMSSEVFQYDFFASVSDCESQVDMWDQSRRRACGVPIIDVPG